MPLRFYLCPLTELNDPDNGLVGRYPAYVLTDLPGKNWSIQDYGPEPLCLLAITVTNAENTTFTGAHSDVQVFPANLDNQVGAGNLTTVQNALETRNIPGSWVTATTTYRQLLKHVLHVFAFCQRMQHFDVSRLFASGITLGTQWNQLPQGVQNKLRTVAEDLHLDTSGMTGTTTVRQILKAIGDQIALPLLRMESETFA